jgi:Predicted small secreted protein
MFPFDVIDESKKAINVYRKEREMKKKIAAAVVLIMCVWTLSGCHTVKGVGQDVESLGGAIEDSSGK